MATHRADQAFRVTLRSVAGVAIFFTAISLFRGGAHSALGAMLGGAAAILNLMAMRRIVASLVSGTAEGDLGRGKAWGTIAVVKLFALLVGVALLLVRGVAPAVPFLFGYVSLPVGIALGALLHRSTDEE